MGAKETGSYEAVFAISLLTSWMFVTALIGMLGWADERSPGRLATWAGIWVFTVAIPTVQALRIQRVLREIVRGAGHVSPRSRQALAHARVLILICGSMTVLLLFGLLAKK